VKTSPINPGDKTGKPGMTLEQYNAAVHAKVAELDAWHKETGIELVMCFGQLCGGVEVSVKLELK
jgi:hypothetical protein